MARLMNLTVMDAVARKAGESPNEADVCTQQDQTNP